MDLLIIVTAISGLFTVVLFILLLGQRFRGEQTEDEVQGGRRVPAGGRNARARLRAAATAQQQVEGDDEEHEKMGAKKRAKLEAKAEKKAQREAEERDREEKKRKKEIEEEERKKIEEKERQEEEKKEEEARKAQEEKERQEHEEYLKLKAAFNIEEEGFEENDDQETLLQDFLNYIKNNKVVLLEDLAAHFKLKTQAVISRIKDLQSSGTLTGVIDDRGKFIYVSQEELEAVAKFVKQRGRVSITELAENSQKLINLTPNVEAV